MHDLRLVSFLGTALISLAVSSAASGATPAPNKPVLCKICTNCHQAEGSNYFRGYLEGISFKAKMLQVKMDNSIETLLFDEDTIQVVNDERKTGDGELLRDNAIKKGHEVKVEYSEKDGVKTVVKLTAKPPVELAAGMLISTAEMEKLIKAGPAKGKYFLFDSRPAPRYQEGAIPGAVNLPFPAFNQMAGKLLPADKKARIIFYCSGVSCNMSPSSAALAKKLGYTNIKVYKDGMPAWSQKHYGVLSAASLQEGWLAKDVSHVLLDARPAGSAGFIRGAVSFPAGNAAQLAKSIDLQQKTAPIIVYDAGKESDAAKVAQELLKAGFTNVKVLTGGMEAWKSAKFTVENGRPALRVVYLAKLRPGEIDVEEFKKYALNLPENMVIIDVRLPAEVKLGMLKTAKAISLQDLPNRMAELPKDKTIIFQCSTGTMAEIAYNILKEQGYSKVKYVGAKVKFEKDGSYSITKE